MVAGYNELDERAATSHKKVFYALRQSDLTEPVKLKEAKKVKRKLVLGIVASLLLVVVFTGACIAQGSNPMSAEELKASWRRMMEGAYNCGNLDALDEHMAADYVRHRPPKPDIEGLEAFKRFVAAMRNAYPDIQLTILEIIAEGDTQASGWIATGTHKDTGERIRVVGSCWGRRVGGKVVEQWHYSVHLEESGE